MGVYSVIVESQFGRFSNLLEFPDDTSLIEATGNAVSPDNPMIIVARGSGSEAELLGVWDWRDDQAVWTPS